MAALPQLSVMWPDLGIDGSHNGRTSFIITGSDGPPLSHCISLIKTKRGSIFICVRTMLGLPIMEIEVLDFLNNIPNVTAIIFVYFFQFLIALIFKKFVQLPRIWIER